MNQEHRLNIIYGIDTIVEGAVREIVKDKGYTYPHPFAPRETDTPTDELVEVYKEVTKEVLIRAHSIRLAKG